MVYSCLQTIDGKYQDSGKGDLIGQQVHGQARG